MLESLTRRYGVLALIVVLLFLVVFSENGLFDCVRLKNRVKAMDNSMKQLENENIVLKAEIDRLQKDDQYLEEVARKRFGFIREGEKVYRIEK
jgi:cell division protein FtsB